MKTNDEDRQNAEEALEEKLPQIEATRNVSQEVSYQDDTISKGT